jgi:hypothetical protein
MWNPFKKAKDKMSGAAMGPAPKKEESKKPGLKGKLFGVGVNMMRKIAQKKLEKMSPQERAKMMQDVMKPENRGKLMSAMEQMKNAGQITEEQYQQAKNKLGA